MVEAWMNEHVGRYGSIVAWRLIGSCSALAVTLDTIPAVSAAVRGLAGATLIMRPLEAFFLDEFPNNEQLAGRIQRVVGRMIGSGTAFMEAMAASWQKIQELSPTEWRSGPRVSF
jgi:hypothetical protein